jgi:hypothetical protein
MLPVYGIASFPVGYRIPVRPRQSGRASQAAAHNFFDYKGLMLPGSNTADG